MDSQLVTVPRAEHPVSRRNLSGNAVRTLYRLRDNGFRAFLVGGCIRDLLLGREPKDFDIATDATPSQIKRLFRNCRLVGRRFRLAHLHFREELIEVATFRSSAAEEDSPDELGIVKDDDGMVLRDNLYGTPEEDAWRRDFTVNALCYDIATFSILDYVGGLDDLSRGIIRTIGDPEIRFVEDPVRMLRAVRFAALLGFEIEPDTWRAIIRLAGHSANASPPRIYEELLKLFLSGEGERCYQLLRQSGIFAALLPGINSWLETESDGFPHVRLGRMLESVDRLTADGTPCQPPLLLALIFGDFLEERAAALQEHEPPRKALDLAVLFFFEELSATIKVPQKTILRLREILFCRQRFRSTPGRRPHSFISRPCFDEALNYFELTADTSDDRKVLSWWRRYLEANPPQAPDPAGTRSDQETGKSDRPRRRRRNRRRRRSPAGSQNPNTEN